MNEVPAVIDEKNALLPWSGEIVDISTPEGTASALAEANRFYYELRRFQQAMKDRLIAESDYQGKGTLHFAAQTVEVESSDSAVEIDWDIAVLAQLEDLGLPPERFGELVTWSPKVDKRVANQLARNPEYRVVIETASERRKPRARKVTVKG